MIIPLLLLFASAGKYIEELTGPTFRDFVLKRSDNDVWLVLFTGMNEPKCFKAIAEFEKASDQAHALAKFAVVNLSEEPFLAHRLMIPYVPYMNVYYSGGEEPYNGKHTAEDYIEVVSSKMPNYVRTFERKWAEESIPSIVLFTDKIKVPTIWATLALKYRDTYCRFGICSELHTHKEFGIARLPTVMFFNGTTIRYRGDLTEVQLQQSINDFLNGTLTVNDEDDDEGFYRNNEFKDHCYGRDFCVISTVGKLNDEIKKIRNDNRRLPLLFFYGNADYPLPGMEENKYYIWNPRRKGIIIVDDVESLPSNLDRVVDGGARWEPVNFDEI